MASPTPPAPQTSVGLAPNIAALLCYAPCCIGLVFSVVVAIIEKQSRLVRFHGFQSLLVHAAWIVVAIGVEILSVILAMVSHALSLIVSLLFLLAGLGMFGLLIFLMIKANSGEEFELPIVGEMARKWA